MYTANPLLKDTDRYKKNKRQVVLITPAPQYFLLP
jgi:hypothetical protein